MTSPTARPATRPRAPRRPAAVTRLTRASRGRGAAVRRRPRSRPARKPELVVETNCGTFTIELDEKASPKTVASVAGLAEAGFYDDTTFHRIIPGFVIQGGDPTATGTGGPGYSTVDTPAETTKYTKGVVAMAKTPTEAPGTSGSQFFVV